MSRFAWTRRANTAWQTEELRQARELHRRPFQIRWIPQHILDQPVPTLRELVIDGVDLTGYIRDVQIGAP